MANGAYNHAVQLNLKAVKLIADFMVTKDDKTLAELYDLMLPTTEQEVDRVIGKLHLQESNIRDDMLQDAFLKLRDLVQWYDEKRCPVFISFWRMSVKNHLLSSYHQAHRPSLIESDEILVDSKEGKVDARVDAEALRQHYLSYVQTWYDRWPKHAMVVPMLVAIINHRIFIEPDEQVPQPVLASSYAVTQGYVAKWEVYMLAKIREDMKHDFE